MEEKYNLHIGDILYEKYYTSEGCKYREVKIVDIFLEKYISGWYTIVKIEHNKITYNHFVSDIGRDLLIKIPVEDNRKVI